MIRRGRGRRENAIMVYIKAFNIGWQKKQVSWTSKMRDADCEVSIP